MVASGQSSRPPGGVSPDQGSESEGVRNGHRGPGARARRRSRVIIGASSASASATYTASYTGHRIPQCPRSGRERLVVGQLDAQVEQVGVRKAGHVVTDVAAQRRPAQDVGCLERHQMRRGQRRVTERCLGPAPDLAVVHEGRDHDRRVDDQGHARSASRSARMLDVSNRDPVASLRARTRSARSSPLGRRASAMSSRRRCSWSERPARAALAASSSCTSSGTSRTVMDVVIAALCMRDQHIADQHIAAQARCLP